MNLQLFVSEINSLIIMWLNTLARGVPANQASFQQSASLLLDSSDLWVVHSLIQRHNTLPC